MDIFERSHVRTDFRVKFSEFIVYTFPLLELCSTRVFLLVLYKNWLFVSIEGRMGSTKIWLPTQQGHSNTATLICARHTPHWRVKLPNCIQELDNLWIDAQFVHPYIAYEWQSAIRGIIKYAKYESMNAVVPPPIPKMCICVLFFAYFLLTPVKIHGR